MLSSSLKTKTQKRTIQQIARVIHLFPAFAFIHHFSYNVTM